MESGTDWLCEILQNVQLEQFYIPIRDQLQVNEKKSFFRSIFFNFANTTTFGYRLRVWHILTMYMLKTLKKLASVSLAFEDSLMLSEKRNCSCGIENFGTNYLVQVPLLEKRLI